MASNSSNLGAADLGAVHLDKGPDREPVATSSGASGGTPNGRPAAKPRPPRTRSPDARRSTPADLADLWAAVDVAGRAAGLDTVGVAAAKPFLRARAEIESRVAAGFAADMQFTFRKPARSTDPGSLLPGATSLVVGACSYLRGPPEQPADLRGRVAKYQWRDHYEPLRDGLYAVSAELRAAGWRTRIVADDNSLVDREAAVQAGLGWYGKNCCVLLPGQGSWFVLGSVATDAPLQPSAEAPVADGCGTCTRCLPACPTGAIVAPGVLDARRCLAWLVQAAGDFPEEYRVALGDRIYGCDDCQEVCPINRRGERAVAPPAAEPDSAPWIDLVAMAMATPAEVLDQFGRWYLPGRDADVLRRNAFIALGNVGSLTDERVTAALHHGLADPNPMIVRHAHWAVDRLATRRGTVRAGVGE